LYNSRENTVTGNTASNIYANIYFQASSDNTITGNTVIDSSNAGIFILDSSSSNAISGNTVTGNCYGIILDSSSGNTISGNAVTANLDTGIFLISSSLNTISGNVATGNPINDVNLSSSSGNTIYQNNFDHGYSDQLNTWNSPGHVTYSYNGTIFNGCIGNFWSEYVGDDLDGNGIGDAPYPIPGPSGDTDNYPLLTYPLPLLPDQCISGRKINNITGEGIAGWTISLYNDTGSPLRNISTNATGWYSFCDLEPGIYRVCEETKPGWTNVTPTCLNVTLSGDNRTGVDFRNDQLRCISGRKINNITGVGIPGWKISLYDDTGSPLRNTSTNATGWYSFCDLEPGRYRVCEETKPGWTNATDTCLNVTLAGDNRIGVDFRNDQLRCISGRKINNITGMGIAGWKISLYDDTGLPLRNTSTNSTGWYSFFDLVPGSYNVCEETKPGWTNATDTCLNVTLAGDSRTGLDFRNDPLLLWISGRKINNITGVGIPGWKISLYNDAGSPLRNTSTDFTGRYWFFDLEPGRYTVCEETKPGWTSASDTCINLTLEVDRTGVDFRNDPLLWIKGRKINNITGAGIPGWKISLYNDTGLPLRNTSTNSTGWYSFFDLEPGRYTVCEETKTGLDQRHSDLPKCDPLGG